MTTRPESALSDVLKHAEHGSVEEFVTALTLARLDLKSAMRCGLQYDFCAANQYLRVLVLNQRRDILDWLLGNDEIVSSVARDVLEFGYEQQSVSFLLWLHKRVNSYFCTNVYIDFDKAMKYGSVEIASYLMNTFPQTVNQQVVSEIHPNAAEFWRNECWPYFLEALFEQRVNPLALLLKCEDVSHAIYALTHGFLSRGLELPAKQKAAYINYETGVAGMAEYRSDFRTWLGWCVDSINTAIKSGHWSCAKLIITAIQETLPDHFPYGEIRYFRVDNLDRMDEKDMSEMIEWSVHCLNTLLLSRYPSLASSAPAEARAILNQQGNIDSSFDVRCVIPCAFVSAIDRDIHAARKALLENETLALVIKVQLESFSAFNRAVRGIIVGEAIRKTSTIEVLVEYGARLEDFHFFINIMQLWDKDPDWIEQFIVEPSTMASRRMTRDVVEEAAIYFCYLKTSPYRDLPYVSMSDEKKIKALLWLSRTSYMLSREKCADYVHQVLQHPLVTAKNVAAFLPNENKIGCCITALGDIAGYITTTSLRSRADVEDIINALLDHVPLERDILPFHRNPRLDARSSHNGWIRPDDKLLSQFSSLKEAREVLLSPYVSGSNIGLVLVVKAHVKRLEAQLKELEDDDHHHHQTQAQQDDTVELKSAHKSLASPVQTTLSDRVRKKNDLCKIIGRYRSLGFVLATEQYVFDFNSAQWLCGEPRDAVAPEYITALYPGFIPTILQGGILSRKLFHHMRTYLGVAHTPQLYLDIIANQPVVPVDSSPNSHFKNVGLLDEVEQAMRSITAAIIGMHHELGCDITADAYKEALVSTHKFLWAYASFRDKEARPTRQVNALQVAAIDIAAVLMIEALDYAVNNSKNTCAPPS